MESDEKHRVRTSSSIYHDCGHNDFDEKERNTTLENEIQELEQEVAKLEGDVDKQVGLIQEFRTISEEAARIKEEMVSLAVKIDSAPYRSESLFKKLIFNLYYKQPYLKQRKGEVEGELGVPQMNQALIDKIVEEFSVSLQMVSKKDPPSVGQDGKEDVKN